MAGRGRPGSWTSADPYHRYDCNHTSELVVVYVGGQVVAETRRAIKLFETSIPPRYYIPIADVTPGCLEHARDAHLSITAKDREGCRRSDYPDY
jgi:uncharacterized protein (DUF427 family)